MPKKAKRMLAKLANGETGGTTALRIVPVEEGFEGETLVVTGRVHEVNAVFLRVARDPETGFLDEFAILINEKVWLGSGLR